MNGAGAVAKILKKEGVEYLFNFPDNAVIDAAAKEEIRPIMVRTERTAVAMADGYSRVSNAKKLGIVAVQGGPGIENAFGGVAQAFSDSSPILVLAGQGHQRRLGQQPNFDAVTSYREITKWAARITTPDRVPQLLRRAFNYMRVGRPGPVLLELPADVATADVDSALIEQYQPVKGARSMADPDDVAAAVGALLAAKRPVIHAGQGVHYSEAWNELRELAELIQAPVMSTLPSKSVFPEDHPLALGTGGITSTIAVAEFLKKADLIFGVGASLTGQGFLTSIPEPANKVFIHATVDERDINKDYRVDYPLLGDARLILRQVIEEVKRQTGAKRRQADGSAPAEIKSAHEAWLKEWMPKLTSDAVPMNPYRVIWELMRAIDPKDAIVTHDSGTPRDMLAPFWKAVTPRGFVGWGKSTHLGWGLGLIMGAKLAAPDKICMNFMGDAAFGMTGMEVETAARNNIATLTIVLNNGLLGGYQKNLPNATERYRTRYITGDYSTLAKALGAYSERVEKPEEIVTSVERAKKAMAEGRPVLLEMMTGEETQLSKYI
jgi:acetolactate synthase-1/2/3 large subunit